METLSRNAPCSCGSGKRYKHCCGALAAATTAAPRPSRAVVMERALMLQKAGRTEEAAALYEAVLAEHADEADALNMLGIIRAGQGRLPEAFGHVRRACELTAWAIPAMRHNFSYVARTALANADSARVARLSRQYRERLDAAATAGSTGAGISVLLYAAPDAATAARWVDELSRLESPPVEIVIAADLAAGLGASAAGPRVRVVAVDCGNPHARINGLAAAATGDCLLALGASAAAAGAILASINASAATWIIALADIARDALLEALLAETVSTGFALLTQSRLVAMADCLLVPRALHEAIAGYRPEAADPLLDYCLRLLWLAEPLLADYAVPAGALPPPPSAPAAAAAASLAEYLCLAATAEASPNPFAPAYCNWGLHFAGHVINRQLFPAAETMGAINDRITAYLERKYILPIATTPGINLVGPARGEFGLAENMRAFARASLAGDIPCAIRDLNLALSTRQGDDSLSAHFAEEARHDCSIFFLNPDSRQLYEQSLDAVVFQRPTLDFRHLKIGYWFWELEKIPALWSEAIAKVDEIWVATEFVAEAIRRETAKPVIKIPTPIGFELKRRYERHDFDLPAGVFLFLFSFDFHSFAERKNPYGLIRAFRRAFPAERKDVALVVKSINGAKKPGAIEALLDSADNDPRILLRDGFLSRDEVFGLQSVADAYVSLHRAEGLGLGLAECMYQGKPVIGTGYSGNLEFMNEANSALVGYSLTPIKKGEYLYDDPGFFWAEPDEDHAAHLMRKMVDDPDYRRTLAERGQREIRSRFNNEATAALMRARLMEIGIL